VVNDVTATGIDFQARHHGEAFQFHIHQHWIRLTWPLGKLVISNVLLLTASWATLVLARPDDPLTRRAMLVFFTLLFLFVHFEFLARFYRYFLYVIVVTDRKIHRIKKTLFVTDEHESIDLAFLQDIQKQQCGIVQSLFGFGTLVLEAQETVARIHFVPCIVENYQRILQLREDALREATQSRPSMRTGGGPAAGQRIGQ
jgi:hypothetical protein